MIDLRHQRPQLSDEALLASHIGGDAAAFAELVARHGRPLHTFLRRFVADDATADDLIQDAFLQAHRSAGRFDPTQTFRPWLYTIAANKARDHLRRSGRRPAVSLDLIAGEKSAADALPHPSAGPLAVADVAETRRRVRATIAALPTIYREVMELAYLEQMPQQQVCRTLGVPLGTVKSRLHVATRAFATAWPPRPTHGTVDAVLVPSPGTPEGGLGRGSNGSARLFGETTGNRLRSPDRTDVRKLGPRSAPSPTLPPEYRERESDIDARDRPNTIARVTPRPAIIRPIRIRPLGG